MTITKISTLRPGLLVSLKTSVTGNVTYAKEEIDPDHMTDNGTREATWQTRRTITDPAEHELAIKVRGKVRSLITAVCAGSAFGLLCPESDADVLASAIKEARALADEFNAEAALTRIHVYVIAGRIAADDVEAVRAINSEVRDLLSDMERGVQNLEVKAIRDAANRAKEIGAMLAPDAQARIQIAIEAARAAAKNIVKAGEQAAQEVDKSTMRKIAEMRTAFLDMDGGVDVAAPHADARALDLAPMAPVGNGVAAPAPALEME